MISLIKTIICCTAISCVYGHLDLDLGNFLKSGVKRMLIEKERGVMSELLSKNSHELDLFKYMRSNLNSMPASSGLVGSFKWQDCGSNSTEMGHINGLSITPDPLQFPGKLSVKFDVDVRETVDAPLKVDLKVQKHEGPIWITIPCISGIGSCTYDDICEMLSGAVCPPVFDDNKVPCKCPFNKGHYSLPTSSFDVNIGEIPGGEYYGKAELTLKSKPVYCLELYFNIA